MSESGKSFTISDRRSFTPDGRRREDSDHVESPPATGSEPAPAPGERPEDRLGGVPGGADFGHFLLSLGAQAGLLLAGEGLPEGASAKEALDGVRSMIAILEMLKDKTEGRRTSAEDEILEGLLFELRMGYVENTRASGS